MITKCEIKKMIVLTIRGTKSLSDVVTDLKMDVDNFLGGYAHHGILEGSKKLY
jgi:hypothetical protein